MAKNNIGEEIWDRKVHTTSHIMLKLLTKLLGINDLGYLNCYFTLENLNSWTCLRASVNSVLQ